MTGEFPAQRASNAENASIWWRHHDSICWKQPVALARDVPHQSPSEPWSRFPWTVIKLYCSVKSLGNFFYIVHIYLDVSITFLDNITAYPKTIHNRSLWKACSGRFNPRNHVSCWVCVPNDFSCKIIVKKRSLMLPLLPKRCWIWIFAVSNEALWFINPESIRVSKQISVLNLLLAEGHFNMLSQWLAATWLIGSTAVCQSENILENVFSSQWL